ncbi:hypothetical protein [Desulfurobacterium sp.]
MRKLLLFLSCFFAVSSAAYGGNVDTFGIGSAETALGGAYSATADDPYDNEFLKEDKQIKISFNLYRGA